MAVVSGGTTLIDNGTLDSAVPTGSLILLSTQTASASANISFTSGIDSTYDSYVFKFIDIHPSATGTKFEFNMSTDGGSNYNVTKTTTAFGAYNAEDNSYSALRYDGVLDLAQGTGFQTLFETGIPNNEESSAGTLILFNPSSTTFVKHFITDCTSAYTYTVRNLMAGYGNTTSAINAVRFQMASGNIDAGTIKLYGVK